MIRALLPVVFPRETRFMEEPMLLAATRGLSLIRIAFGLYFIASVLRKTTGGWLTSGEQLTRFVQGQLEESAAVYRPLLEDVVLPNADLFARLTVAGEWVAGISLTLGLLTRVGSIVGMWLVLNFMLAKGLPNFEGSEDRLFFLSCGVFAVCAAGLVWGLDGALRPYLSANPVTRWLAGIPAQTIRRPATITPFHRSRRREQIRRAA
jgi:uncharacterized membrane protein YphA (DoxX/SURF4 family)